MLCNPIDRMRKVCVLRSELESFDNVAFVASLIYVFLFSCNVSFFPSRDGVC